MQLIICIIPSLITCIQFYFFSYSCGYKRVFNEYQTLLRKKYPEVQIIGDNYNPPGYNMILAKGLVSI